jgi:hypothetical protein
VEVISDERFLLILFWQREYIRTSAVEERIKVLLAMGLIN